MLLGEPTVNVGLCKFNRIGVGSGGDNRNELGRGRNSRCGSGLPVVLPPLSTPPIQICIPTRWLILVLFGGCHRHLAAQIADQCHLQPQGFTWMVRQREGNGSRCNLTNELAMPICREGNKGANSG